MMEEMVFQEIGEFLLMLDLLMIHLNTYQILNGKIKKLLMELFVET